MAAVTSAVVATAASAYSSYRGARQQEKQQQAANARLNEGIFGNVNISTPDGAYGNYNPTTGRITTGLGDRLQGQLDTVDQFANMFASRDPFYELAGARGTLADRQSLAYQQPATNFGLFDQLQGEAGAARGLAGANLFGAANDAMNLSGFGNQAFGLASQQLGDIGNAEQARSRQLDLLRQQAAPFEQRAFSGLLDKQFAMGQLGSSGGALQTEAFARGLGQADLDRQLQASAEARRQQTNALNLAQGGFNMGRGQRTLSDSLLGNAFTRFGSMSNLAQDIEGARYGQATSSQQNFFNQLGQIMQNQIGMAGQQRSFQQQDFGNFLQALGAGQTINQIPMDQLRTALAFEQARSNAAIGVGSSMLDVQRGQQMDVLASTFGSLASGAMGAAGGGGWGGFFSGLTGGST